MAPVAQLAIYALQLANALVEYVFLLVEVHTIQLQLAVQKAAILSLVLKKVRT